MTVHCATIYPAFQPKGDGLADLISMPSTMFTYFWYERICGYSLGNTPKFFQTAADVNTFYVRQSDSVNDPWFKYGCAELKIGALVEFTVNTAGQVVSLNKIRTIPEQKNELITIPHSGKIVRQISPVWDERTINTTEVTPAALKEFNRLYQEHQQPPA